MSRKTRKNVGVIGLGIIGLRVASGLRAVGFQVFVWNRSAKPAPNFLGSAAEVAEACEIIQCFVADAAALFNVIEAIGEALTPRHLFVCNATVGPEATLEAARRVEMRGAKFLDAPFTGSKLAAEKRQLVYYIGGDDATFLRARPVLEATSKAIVRIGGIGHAATVKVVTNMIAAVQVQALAEALAIVKKAGLAPEVLAAAVEQNACRSGVIELKLPKMIAGDYDPHFSLKHMFKDLQLGIQMANALELDIPATAVTAGVMFGALNQGLAELDFSSLFKIYAPQQSAVHAAHARPLAVEKRGELPAPAAVAPTEKTAASVPTWHAAPTPAAVRVEELKSAARATPEPVADTPERAEAGGRIASHDSGDELSAAVAVARHSNVETPGNSTSEWSSYDGAPGTEAADLREGEHFPDAPAQPHETPGHALPAELAAPLPANSDAEATGDSAARPMNYVRRWFVSHSGGSA